jgi:hypothetical protein
VNQPSKSLQKLPELFFGTPRKLPRASDLKGRVVVLDIAFASEAASGGFEKVTLPLIQGLGPRLAMWVDHHDHARHAEYASDPRFVLHTKAEHGACPEIVTPALVERAGAADTILCHTDFDGLASAAKWIRGGIEPYAGCDDDARAIDTMLGKPSKTADRIERALRGAGRDEGVMGIVVRHLARGLEDSALWSVLDVHAAKYKVTEEETRELAKGYRVLQSKTPIARKDGRLCPRVAFVRVESNKRFDKTMLLMQGQERADYAIIAFRDTLSFAAAFDSGLNFLELLSLSGGMPTVASVPITRLAELATKLGIDLREVEA